MSKVYIYNGEDWCNICSGKAKIRVPSESWVQVAPLSKATEIFNGEEWVPLDCCYDCYVDTPLPRPTFQGDRLDITTEDTFNGTMDFMDDIDIIPTCEELKNLLCAGEGVVYPTRGFEQELNSIYGCPECTYQAWIDGTPATQLPSVTNSMVFLPPILDELTPLPETGNPGEIIRKGDYYMWNEVENQWTYLDPTIEDIQYLIRSKRDQWIMKVNELIFINSPFIWANDYLPFHRWKAEEI